ncbi:MAG: helix-turn-helix domain-containing protein [Nocardioides sp.]|uniref:helix-turn-helix domain-containing protein n=1 Tax=Nocardioides sp. TaxID=35761 RepID=UPI0039E5A48B
MDVSQIEPGREIVPPITEDLLTLAGSALDADSFRSRNDALSRICDYAQARLGCLEVVIRVREDDSTLVISGTTQGRELGDYDAVLGLGDETLSSAFHGQRSPSVEVLNSGRPRFVRDADMDPDLPTKERLRQVGIRSAFYYPIVRQGVVFGVLAIFWDEDRVLSDEDLSFVAAISRISAIAAMTAVFADQTDALRRESDELSAQLQRDNVHLRKVLSAQSRMIQILSEGSSLAVEQLSGVLASAFDSTVLITDREQHQLAYSGRPTLADQLRGVATADLLDRPGPEDTEDDDFTYTLLRMNAPGTHTDLGNVVLSPAIDPDDEVGSVMLRQVVLALSAHLYARRTDRALSTAVLPVSLLALTRDLFSQSLLKEASARFGISQESRLCLGIAATPTPEAAMRLSRAQSVFEAARWPCITAVADGSDVLVLLKGGAVDASAAQRLMTSQPQVEQIGFSSPFHGLDRIPNAFHEARTAKKLAASTGRFAFYDVLGTFAEVTGAMSVDQMVSFVSKVLGPVVRYDEKRDTNLLDTLKIFVENNGRAPETARAMSIHVNTLHKRIARIEEITGISLHSFQDLSRVLLALDIMPTLMKLEVNSENE